MPSSEEILDLLARIAESEEVRHDPGLRLYDLQILDSMRTVELLVAISQDLGLEIHLADFDRESWATPQKFMDDLLSRAAAAR